ncbi:GIY-YIG nuclease family protein [Vibrio sp. SM6]|uniref:GIY-YIG nuclease family protein n=1 Tax=Vibrio agarilyticus TaxID=2726741 RepID=A0A7X8TP45_9VIBR|nr:GIY-YIG nuclease family protein [Vibrio agarilyticus]NLS12119.1 GIY-YIG nuclease family protein [Vibrio agarilyticus]
MPIIPSGKVATSWSVYFVRTRFNALYCGISNDVERRFALHQAGRGAKALRGKMPLQLVWQYHVGSRSLAARVEYALKQLPKSTKEQLILGHRKIHIDHTNSVQIMLSI